MTQKLTEISEIIIKSIETQFNWNSIKLLKIIELLIELNLRFGFVIQLTLSFGDIDRFVSLKLFISGKFVVDHKFHRFFV